MMTNEDIYKAIMSVKEATDFMSTQFTRRFDGIDERLDGIDGRLDGIDGRLDRIEHRLDGHDRRFDRLETRLEAVEDGVRDLRADVAHLTERLS